MKLTKTQLRRLKELSDESYIHELPETQWEPRRQELLAEISDAFELNAFAMNVNWDGGTEDLEWVLNHKDCDLATALMIYAHGEPGFYYGRQEKGSQFRDFETEDWAFLKSIEQRVSQGSFQYGKVAFNPRDSKGEDYYRVDSANPGNQFVPEFMKCSTPGESIENQII